MVFATENNHSIEVFTTRPDTLFGVSFLVLSPEHKLVNILTTKDQDKEVSDYLKISKLKKYAMMNRKKKFYQI